MLASTRAITSTVRYELPPRGISLLGYVVRRMHKTVLLAPVAEALKSGQGVVALEHIALYCAGASTSYGPAYYQPEFNRVGAVVSEADPATGAVVTAMLEAVNPHYRLSYTVKLPEGGQFTGMEEITGTTVGLSGLGMPAPSQFTFTTPDGSYTAQAAGIITSELAPGLFRWSIRAHGSLQLKDSLGHTGQLHLARDGEVSLAITTPSGVTHKRKTHIYTA